MKLTLHQDRWLYAASLAERWVQAGEPSAITCLSGNLSSAQYFHRGTLDVAGTRPLPEQPLYLVASITKPLVAMATLLLIEQGEFTLGTRVCDLLPEFGRQGKYGIDVRHLLTHTSGLPDMLPNNDDLRARNAPLSDFFTATCEVPLEFAPGKAVQYQSMGFVVLSEIIRKQTGQSCGEFLRQAILEPLQMRDTVLGVPDEWFSDTAANSPHPACPLSRIVEVRLTPAQAAASHWNWNSRYWRQLGAPWGGLLTTATDLAKLARCLLRHGQLENGGVLFSPATVAAATRNQLDALRDVPEVDRRTRSWGLGWRRHWPGHSANFGDLLSPATYGHWGATGTVMWIDPEQEFYAIILSNQPQEPAGWFLSRLSNAVAAAWVPTSG